MEKKTGLNSFVFRSGCGNTISKETKNVHKNGTSGSKDNHSSELALKIEGENESVPDGALVGGGVPGLKGVQGKGGVQGEGGVQGKGGVQSKGGVQGVGGVQGEGGVRGGGAGMGEVCGTGVVQTEVGAQGKEEVEGNCDEIRVLVVGETHHDDEYQISKTNLSLQNTTKRKGKMKS